MKIHKMLPCLFSLLSLSVAFQSAYALAPQGDDCIKAEGQLSSLGSQWTSHDSKPWSFSDNAEYPTLLGFFYAHCTTSCPLTVKKMQDVASALPKDVRKDVRFVLVTLDNSRDTNKALKEMVESLKLKSPPWTLISGDRDGLMDLTASLGFKFKKKADGEILHDNTLFILNKKTELCRRFENLAEPVETLVTTLTRLAKAKK